jgi:Fe-S-cluster-containing dehydrogenase component
MACKINNNLPDQAWWATVRTMSGKGIDRPNGVWPTLTMSWMPVYSKDCVLCAGRTSKGEEPHCTNSCPTLALTYGDLADASSEVSKKIDNLVAKGFKIFRMPVWENTKDNIVYATRR